MLLLAASLFACSDLPLWAIDPIVITPQDPQITVEERWHVFTTKTIDAPNASPLCERSATFTATTADLCAQCEHSWSLISDGPADPCDFSNRSFPSPTLIGLGPLPSEWLEGAPYPNLSQGVWISYNEEAPVFWGWAYPQSLDQTGGADGPAWNNRQAFALRPAFAFRWPDEP